jgi:chromosomal replication initiation ATPase DnaA
MKYNETDLYKIHSLALKGLSLRESIATLRSDKNIPFNEDKLKMLGDAVAIYTGVSIDEMSKENRVLKVSTARSSYLYLACLMTSLPLTKIARSIKKHHATVIHNKNKIKNLLEIGDIETKKLINDIITIYDKALRWYNVEQLKELEDVH